MNKQNGIYPNRIFIHMWSWHQHVSGTEVQIEHVLGLPWWLSGEESACQGRGHGFKP